MTEFSSLKIVGGLLPADLLGRIFAGDPQVPGTSPQTYGLERGESVAAPGRPGPGSTCSRSGRTSSSGSPVTTRPPRPGSPASGGCASCCASSASHHLTAGSFEIEGKSFPVSHQAGHVPIHLLGWGADLDHRTPHGDRPRPAVDAAGAAQPGRRPPVGDPVQRRHAAAAARLRRADRRRLRRVRPGGDLRRRAVRRLRAALPASATSPGSRSRATAAPHPAGWSSGASFAADQGQRALDQLRDGVEQAIAILGTGFLSHPANPQLRIRLGSGELKLDDLNRALLRLVYRLLFWFVAEDRGALLQPDPETPTNRQGAGCARPASGTTTTSPRPGCASWPGAGAATGTATCARPCSSSSTRSAPRAASPSWPCPASAASSSPRWTTDARSRWTSRSPGHACRTRRCSARSARCPWSSPATAAPGGGSTSATSAPRSSAASTSPCWNWSRATTPSSAPTRWQTLAGNERKKTGSYYTPTSLVECLLDSALDPLLDEACAHGTAEERVAALLGLTVCDPACGSGHFLVAAARRIAKRIAAEETGDPEPPDAVVRAALRDVVGRCIYGVDINPMAAELAKVSLWLEALEPGKPLSFLDQHIRVGNSLLGVTPALLAEGLPDAAFTPIEGDDRKVCSALKKQNAAERQGQHDLFSPAGIPVTNATLAKRAAEIARTLPESLEDLHIHQQRQAAGTRRVPRTPHPEAPGRRLVRRLRPAQDRGNPRHRDHPGGPGAVRRRRRHAGPGSRRGPGSGPDPPVPLLPLARRVPPHLPRRQRRHRHRPGHRLVRRLLLRHRQPALGAGQAPGAGVLRRPQPGHRQCRERRRPQEADRSPLRERQTRRPGPVRRVPGRAAQGSRLELPAPRIRPLPADRPRRRQHLRRLRRNRPHGHRRRVAAAAWSCPPASPPTPPPRRSSATLSATAKLVSFLDFENEAFLLSRAVHHRSASACSPSAAARRV